MPKRRAQAAKQPEPEGRTEARPSPLEVLAAWNLELSRFYLHRSQHYWKMPMRMHSLLTQNDLKEAQTTFLAELLDDYRSEAAKLAEIVGADPKRQSEPPARDADQDYAASLLQAQEDAAAEARAQEMEPAPETGDAKPVKMP